ncbi:hypothetical protein AB3G45_19575 [Shinella sp. S4-D37]|uniref:hypothetical protein n=1 Tax=Shinella sp. S4-D37 TaxID=3161999 RepID=UPI00346622B7
MALTLTELLKRLTGGASNGGDSRAPIEQVALGSTSVPTKPQEDSGLFSQLFPSDPAKKSALGRSLLQGGAGMMIAGGPSRNPTNLLQAIGAGLASGGAAYDTALEAGQKQHAEQVKLAQAKKLQDMQASLFGGAGSAGAPSGDNGDFGYSIAELKKYLQYQIAAGDDAGARDTLGMIQKLQQEAASKGMVVGEGGTLEAAPGYNEGLGATEEVKAGGRVRGEEAHRQTDDIREYNLYVEQTEAAGGVPDDFTTWMRAGKAAGAMKINMGENSNKFGEKSDEEAAKRIAGYVEEGASAPQMIGDMQLLIDLGKNIGTGKIAEFKLALGPYAEMAGIKIDGLSDAQAYDAVTSRLAPQMRPAGAGATSDFDAKQYLKSIPSLGLTPEGNEIIAGTMQSVAQNKLDAAEIAARAQRGEISWQDAETQIRALPNPYERFKQFQKEQKQGKSDKKKDKPVEADSNGNIKPGYEEDGYIFQGGDPGDPNNWISKNLL